MRALPGRFRRLALPLSAALLLVAAPATAAEPVPPDAEAEPAGPVPIPIASIVVRGSALEADLREIESDLAAPAAQQQIADALPQVEQDLRARSRRLSDELQKSYNRGDLEGARAGWRSSQTDLARWQTFLAARLSTLNDHRTVLERKLALWRATAGAARAERAPAEVREVIDKATRTLESTETKLRKARDAALALQRNVVELQTRVQTQIDAIDRARDDVLRHVLTRNQPLPWDLEPGDVEANRAAFLAALQENREALLSYAIKHTDRINLHVLLIATLIWIAVKARRTLLSTADSHGRSVPPALERPIAAAIVLGLTATVWLHPDAPPVFGQVATVLALPWWFLVLRGLLPEELRKPLIGFLILVPLESIRHLVVSFDVLARLLLVLQAAGFLAGIVWLRRPARLALVPPAPAVWTGLLGTWLRFALAASAVSVLAAAAGWTILGDLLLSTVARGSFVGSVLFTAVRVVEDAAEAVVYSGLLRRIRTVDRARPRFLRGIQRGARSVGLLTWIYLLLGYLAVQGSVIAGLRDALATPLGYGNVQVTLGGVIAFGVTIWLSWLLSRMMAAVLEGEVFSRVGLPRGVPFALSTISRYVVLVLGFVLAVAALGVEVGNLALLVSALGVGIGFGMQNIVNNFISGLILLFERPIKVGDMIALDTLLGEVRRIGIRASLVRTFDGADVIVPNGDLISSQLTNWTFADSRRRVHIPVGVAYGTPATRVIELLEEVARNADEVLEDPAPMALFQGFGDSSLDFELRIWSDSADALTLVRSRIVIAIQQALAEAGIEVPFPQRDLYLKSVPGRARPPVKTDANDETGAAGERGDGDDKHEGGGS